MLLISCLPLCDPSAIGEKSRRLSARDQAGSFIPASFGGVFDHCMRTPWETRELYESRHTFDFTCSARPHQSGDERFISGCLTCRNVCLSSSGSRSSGSRSDITGTCVSSSNLIINSAIYPTVDRPLSLAMLEFPSVITK